MIATGAGRTAVEACLILVKSHAWIAHFPMATDGVCWECGTAHRGGGPANVEHRQTKAGVRQLSTVSSAAAPTAGAVAPHVARWRLVAAIGRPGGGAARADPRHR